MFKKHGFTLIELIIVIAIISLIAAAVFVSVNPAKRLGDTKDAVRAADTIAIEKAIQKTIVNNISIPSALAVLATSIPYMIVTEGGDDTGIVERDTLDQKINRVNIVGDFIDYIGSCFMHREQTSNRC